ncbi:uncharacterized protein V1516DRAFT_668930 [Lipomyces oligophaga]|uniref:uncharacterized protein n=1 Tax=Lipomyces oligophaga TaxID=45792 RepID=UPI0034CF3D2C
MRNYQPKLKTVVHTARRRSSTLSNRNPGTISREEYECVSGLSNCTPYFQSSLLSRNGAIMTAGATNSFPFCTKLPKLSARPVIQIPAAATLISALAERDSFGVWQAYLQIKAILQDASSSLASAEIKHAALLIVSDRRLFTDVLKTLDAPVLLVPFHLRTIRRAKSETSWKHFKSVDSLALIDSSSFQLPISSASLLPLERFRSSGLFEEVTYVELTEFWTRLHTVLEDIVSIYGKLTRDELSHWLNQARACDETEELHSIWEIILGGNDALKRWKELRDQKLNHSNPTKRSLSSASDETHSSHQMDVFEGLAEEVAAEIGFANRSRSVSTSPSTSVLNHEAVLEHKDFDQADVRMWNTYISGISATKSNSLKVVQGFGDIANTPADPAFNPSSRDSSWVSAALKREHKSVILDEPRESIFESVSTGDLTAEVALEELRKDAVLALQLVELMITSGVLPDSVTYEILLLSFAKAGDLSSMREIIRSIWNIDFSIDNNEQPDPAIIQKLKDPARQVNLFNRNYPSSVTLISIKNAFQINNRPDLAATVVQAFLEKYLITNKSHFNHNL